MATYSGLPNKLASAVNGIDYAYRDAGEGPVPLVLLQHFRGNLDNWDPALIDALASTRRVVAFDNVGVGGSTGTTPHVIEQMAHDAIAFLAALEFGQADILGFSIGSFVAQEIALIRPDLVRRLILASSAPRGAAGMHGWAPEVIGAVGRPETNPEGYLEVFFARSLSSQQAGRDVLRRIYPRPRTGTSRPPGPPARRNTMRSAPGGSPITPCCSGSAASASRCSWPTATVTR